MEKRPKINTAVESENSVYFGFFEVYTGGGRAANPETFHTLMTKTPFKGWPPVFSTFLQVIQYVFDD